MTTTPPDPDRRLDVSLAEYASLRSDLARHRDVATHLVATGLIGGTVAVTAAGSLGQESRDVIQSLLPAFSAGLYLVWFGDVERMARLRKFLRYLEVAINERLGGSSLLSWESWRATHRLRYPYRVSLGVFCGVGFLGPMAIGMAHSTVIGSIRGVLSHAWLGETMMLIALVYSAHRVFRVWPEIDAELAAKAEDRRAMRRWVADLVRPGIRPTGNVWEELKASMLCGPVRKTREDHRSEPGSEKAS